MEGRRGGGWGGKHRVLTPPPLPSRFGEKPSGHKLLPDLLLQVLLTLHHISLLPTQSHPPSCSATRLGVPKRTAELAAQLDAQVAAWGGDRPIHSVLVANNGLAATKFIRSVRSWAYKNFGNERAGGGWLRRRWQGGLWAVCGRGDLVCGCGGITRQRGG